MTTPALFLALCVDCNEGRGDGGGDFRVECQNLLWSVAVVIHSFPSLPPSLVSPSQLVGKDALAEGDKVILETARLLREDYLAQNAFTP